MPYCFNLAKIGNANAKGYIEASLARIVQVIGLPLAPLQFHAVLIRRIQSRSSSKTPQTVSTCPWEIRVMNDRL